MLEYMTLRGVTQKRNVTSVAYAQTEEILAVLYDLEEFHCYTLGREVRVLVDYKPQVSICLKPLSKAPKWLQNLLLHVLQFNDALIDKTRKGERIGKYAIKRPNNQTRNGGIVRCEQSDNAAYTRPQTSTDPMQLCWRFYYESTCRGHC